MLGGFWFTDLLIERSGYEPSEPSQGLCCDLRQDTLQKTVDTNKSSGKPEGRTLGWLSSWSLERFWGWGGGGMQPPYQEIGFNRVWATCGSPACDGYFR